MAGAIPAAQGRIFISYRREDTAYPAGWLYDRLADRFAKGQVFKDVDSIELGDDFVQVITAAVGSCDVLLTLIGDRWLTVTGEDGRRRLDDPDDFVRLEIEAALARNVRVIPILVEGARMPRAEELPSSLAGLVRRQALELSPARFEADTGRLLRVLDETLAEAQAQREAQAQAQREAEARQAAAGGAATGVGGAAPRQVSVGTPAAAPPAPRWRGFDQVPLLRRRQLLLGAGAVAVALAIVVGFLLVRDGEPRNPRQTPLQNPLLVVRGSIESPGVQDRYTATGRQGQQVYLDAKECAATGILVWTLLRPDGEAVFQDQTVCDTNSPSDQTVTLPQDGTYQLTVSGSDNATGTYRITLWSVPAAQEFSIKIGDTIGADRPAKGAGNIESPGAQDRYTFTAGRGQQVFFDARQCTSAGILVWTLLRPDDEAVFQDQTVCDSNSPSDLTRTLPLAGDYRLIVSGSNAATGTYRITLWSVPTPQQFSLAIGGTIAAGRPGPGAGNIESPGEQERYTFTADKGQQIYLEVRECASNGTLVWTLLRPDDEPVFENETLCSGDTGSNQEWTLPQAGDYRLIVGGSDAATGTYRVKIQSR
jgi:predicted secreted protein